MDGHQPVGGYRVGETQGTATVFRWLREVEQEIGRSPMDRVCQPKVPQKLSGVVPGIARSGIVVTLMVCSQ
jgi:hypothetical protein